VPFSPIISNLKKPNFPSSKFCEEIKHDEQASEKSEMAQPTVKPPTLKKGNFSFINRRKTEEEKPISVHSNGPSDFMGDQLLVEEPGNLELNINSRQPSPMIDFKPSFRKP